jgi:hypothetical protein
MTRDPILVGSTPVQITNAGESGTVWLCEDGSSELCQDVFVFHAGRSACEGLRITQRLPNGPVMEIDADDSSDYYMAVSKSKTAYVVVDMV